MATNEIEYEEGRVIIAVKDIVAGAFGGALQCIVGHPLDTVKVRLQTSTGDKYRGMMHCFRTMIKEEGLFSIYRGVQSPLVGIAALTAVDFLAYGQSKKLLANENGELTIPRCFAAGLLAGIGVSMIESPVDLFKCQLQVRYKEYNGLVDCAKKIAKRHGIRGVYQGLGATLARDVPSTGLYFGFYEVVKRMLAKPGQDLENLEAWKILLAGAVGGVMFWGPWVYWLDVVKSSMQSDTPVKAQREFPTIIKTVKKIYNTHGIRAFFRGFVPCILRSAPANAVTFLGYEYAHKLMARLS
jgi:solute carrier family 25 carnitine/acylcarnitine transporter 20/29